jgi:hypothetical protein
MVTYLNLFIIQLAEAGEALGINNIWVLLEVQEEVQVMVVIHSAQELLLKVSMALKLVILTLEHPAEAAEQALVLQTLTVLMVFHQT